MATPPIPSSLRSVQHHYKTAQEHDTREAVVAYYCRMYVLQRGMQLDKSSPEAKAFLFALMDKLEADKAALAGDDTISNETVAQAHVENYALRMFAFADTEDRECRHSKNVVKSFYTAGMLFDVLSVFGETGDDIEKYKKYAKYKAAYIHKCLKNGVQPNPGPVGEDGEDLDEFGGMNISGAVGGAGAGAPSSNYQPPPAQPQMPPAQAPAAYVPPAEPAHTPAPAAQPPQPSSSGSSGGYIDTQRVDWEKATKMAKYAVSSMTYEDRDAAVDFLRKAMNLLTVGHE